MSLKFAFIQTFAFTKGFYLNEMLFFNVIQFTKLYLFIQNATFHLGICCVRFQYLVIGARLSIGDLPQNWSTYVFAVNKVCFVLLLNERSRGMRAGKLQISSQLLW